MDDYQFTNQLKIDYYYGNNGIKKYEIEITMKIPWKTK